MTAIDEARAALAGYEWMQEQDTPRNPTGVTMLEERLASALRALIDPPTDDEREALRIAVGRVLFNASNFPARVQTRLLGQDMAPLNEKLTAAVLAAGFRLQAPLAESEVDAALESWFSVTFTGLLGGAAAVLKESVKASHADRMQAALEAAREARQ